MRLCISFNAALAFIKSEVSPRATAVMPRNARVSICNFIVLPSSLSEESGKILSADYYLETFASLTFDELPILINFPIYRFNDIRIV